MDRHVAVVVVRVLEVVEVGGQAYVDAAKRVDHVAERDKVDRDVVVEGEACHLADLVLGRVAATVRPGVLRRDATDDVGVDRKSTRLNSSHPSISYAVFCLKKKKKR